MKSQSLEFTVIEWNENGTQLVVGYASGELLKFALSARQLLTRVSNFRLLDSVAFVLHDYNLGTFIAGDEAGRIYMVGKDCKVCFEVDGGIELIQNGDGELRILSRKLLYYALKIKNGSLEPEVCIKLI